MSTRDGVPQIPIIREGFLPYLGKAHRATGIMCPGCCYLEVVYNGNYFCAGFDEDYPLKCDWGLRHWDPHPDNPQYDEPKPMWDLVDALVKIGCAGGREGSAW